MELKFEPRAAIDVIPPLCSSGNRSPSPPLCYEIAHNVLINVPVNVGELSPWKPMWYVICLFTWKALRRSMHNFASQVLQGGGQIASMAMVS